MPSGYRDVKVSPIVNGHLCEIQLHLQDFYSLKAGQHEVYEWARELNVTTELSPSYLLRNLSNEVMAEMIRLSRHNWRGTEDILPSLHKAAGNFLQAQEGFSKVACSAAGFHLSLHLPCCLSHATDSPRSTYCCRLLQV